MKNIIVATFVILFTISFFSCEKQKTTSSHAHHSQKEIEALKKELGDEFDTEFLDSIEANTPEIQAELDDFLLHPEKEMIFDDERFLPYLTEIYMFPDAYEGHKVTLQGAYKHQTYDTGEGKSWKVDFIYRETKGCEGDNIIVQGFEFTKKSGSSAVSVRPKDGDWLEISGIIKTYEVDNITFLKIEAEKIKILETPGKLYLE